MARKKRDSGGGYSWMDTYGDMVTLLLTFFIMLFSMSTVNEDKWKILVQAFSRTSGAAAQQVVIGPSQGDGDNIMPSTGEDDLNIGEPDIINEKPIDLNELYEFLMAFIEQNNMEAEVKVEKDSANNVYISFDNNIFFDGDKSNLRPESYPVLTFIGDCLKSVEEQVLMTCVIGHTAYIPGSAVNDWLLSMERASKITTFFEATSGLDTKKVKGEGYGSNYPVASNETPEGRAKNRRVQIMVIGNDLENSSQEDLAAVIRRLVGADVMQNPQDEIMPDGNGNQQDTTSQVPQTTDATSASQ